MIYWFTVSWDGIDEYTEGSVSYSRDTYEQAVEGIKHYLTKYKNREAYPTGLSMENGDESMNLLTPILLKHLIGE
jgi:hypothetical protein